MLGAGVGKAKSATFVAQIGIPLFLVANRIDFNKRRLHQLCRWDRGLAACGLGCSAITAAAISIIAGALHFSGCSGGQSDKIVGTWQTGFIPSEWGSNRITVTYYADGRVFGTNDFVSGGSLSWQGIYRVRGGIMQRTINGSTETIGYRITGDTMYQTLGDEDYIFSRVSTKSDGATNGKQPVRLQPNTTPSAVDSRR
jgi:hypothetical protein